MNDEKAIEFAKKLNENYTDSLNIPILGGFKVIDNPGTMFTAVSEDGYMQQFIVDGKLKDNETFEEHLETVIMDTKKSMRDSGLANPDKHIKFLRKYSANGLDFTIYIQDNIIDSNNIKKLIRQFNIYFLENNSKAFQLLTVSTPPFDLTNTTINIDEIDLEKDDITISLNNTCTDIMDHISYK